jgi:mono/diheme cytochrome c family protein
LKDEEALFLQRLSKDPTWEKQNLNQIIFFEMLSAAIAAKDKSPAYGEASGQEQANLQGADLQAFTKGKMHYLNVCAGCHGTDGKGLKRFAPPLVQSEWVIGDERKLALLLLHGLEGPIEVNGTQYDAPDILPVMPSHSTLPDQDIANILTYIRNDWGNEASAIEGRMVGKTRVTSQGRVIPWTAEELLKLPNHE